jgi:ATP-dependent Clp protease ATP-binding subunit ClpC
MYERFTEKARKVMQCANEEAIRQKHHYINTEDMLAGLVLEGSGVAFHVLKSLQIDLNRIRIEANKLAKAGYGTAGSERASPVPQAKKVIEFAIEEARNLNHAYVGTEHLLLGLTRDEEGQAARILVSLNLPLASVRERIIQLLGVTPEPQQVVEPAEKPFLPPLIRQAVKGLEVLIPLIDILKENAIAGQDFQWAAELRDYK